MKKIAKLSINSVYGLIDSNKMIILLKLFMINKIFGLDFMIDEDFKVYLIEVNTNPSLEM